MSELEMLGFFLGKQVSWLSYSGGPNGSKRKWAEEPFMRRKLPALEDQAEPRRARVLTWASAGPATWGKQ